MKISQFDNLPDDARLWVYGFDRPLDPAAKEQIANDLEAFVL